MPSLKHPQCKDFYHDSQIKIAQFQILFCYFQTGVKKSGVRMFVAYQCEFTVSEKIIIFAHIAHHAKTIPSCNGIFEPIIFLEMPPV
jgi:hypothetical protein